MSNVCCTVLDKCLELGAKTTLSCILVCQPFGNPDSNIPYDLIDWTARRTPRDLVRDQPRVLPVAEC